MSKSENGWEPLHAGSDILNWIDVPGTSPVVRLQFMKGWPTQILRAFAADFNAYVEPLRDGDSAAFTATNSVATSNHLNGTACDLNWNGADGKTFRLGISKASAYPGDRAAHLDELIAFYEGMVFCGGNWSIKDWMHFQMGGNTWMNPKTQDFINRKIRADGFSTFKRSGTTPPPPPPPPVLGRVDRYALLVMAEGQRRGVTPRGIQIAFSVCFVESNWKNYANSNVPESLLIPHDAVGSDHDSLGLFQQRCPMWGPAEVLMNPTLSAGLFYDRLVKMDYNNPARLPGDFAADVQRPAAQYRYRYQERMGDAVSLYNKVVGITAPPPPGEDELSAEAERKIAEIHAKQFDSISMYAVGPRKVPQAEAYGWDQRVESSALRGEEWALSLVRQAGDGTLFGVLRDGKPDQFLVEHARAVYREAVTTPADGPTTVARLATSPQVVEKIVYRDPPPAPVAPPEIVYLPAPLPEVSAAALAPEKTPGQLIGDAYDALEKLRLADALPIENRAPLAALIAVLQTKNGSQI